MVNKLSNLVFTSLVLVTARLFAAAPLEPALDAILTRAPADSLVTVLVRPALDVEMSLLEADLLRTRASRSERHRR
ncbi:MAG TPA: hypothetical protein VJ417_05030, partial [Candidatus Glassbacteria bacterium]|nr:hypothetical protein [Candidatus Glassbacteria bacterium]